MSTLTLSEEEILLLIDAITEGKEESGVGLGEQEFIEKLMESKEGILSLEQSIRLGIALKEMDEGGEEWCMGIIAETILPHLHPDVIKSLEGWAITPALDLQATRGVLEEELRKLKKRRMIGSLHKKGPEI
jgi:hypothetical protein